MNRADVMLSVMLALWMLVIIGTIDANADHLKTKPHKDLKEIKFTDTAKSVKITKITKSRTLHVWSIVEVQVCAGMEKLYSPDLELTSDKHSVQVTMWGLFMPKSCKINEFFIRAEDHDSISVGFLNQNYREPTR